MRHPFDGIIGLDETTAIATQPHAEAKLGRRSALGRLLGAFGGMLAASAAQQALAAPHPGGQGFGGQARGGFSTGQGGGGGWSSGWSGQGGFGGGQGYRPPSYSSPGRWGSWYGRQDSVTTYALGEEGGWQRPSHSWHYPSPGPGNYTTQALGEEGGSYTTQALGEEGGYPAPGWSTTQALGEEGGYR